jgi:hypothetical protein
MPPSCLIRCPATGLFTLWLCAGLAGVVHADDGTPLPEGVIACLRPKQSGHRGNIETVVFSPDGTIVASGSYSGGCLWEPGNKEPVRRLTPSGKNAPQGAVTRSLNIVAARFTDSGKQLVTGGGDGTIRTWDAVTGKELARVGDPDGLTSLVAFDRCVRTVAVARHSLEIDLLDPKTGERLRRFEPHRWEVDGIALSDDGKLMASADRDGNLRLWDTGTGKELPQLPGSEKAGNPSLSPDGRLVAGEVEVKSLRVWDTATGRMVQQIRVEKGFLHSAFSQDGRVVAVDGNGLLQLFEVATGKERLRLKTGNESAWCLAFSPDGTRLAVGDWGGTVWLYDATGRKEATGPPVALPSAELDAFWSDLASLDGHRAGLAVHAFIDVPAAAVGLLASRLTPARVDAEKVARLVKDLDNEAFAAREQATAALEAIGDPAEGELRRVLKAGPSPEVGRRLEALLERARQRPLANEEARELRAVEVLEHVATPDARKLLQKLAKGVPEARLTREAVASLQRLDGLTSNAAVNKRR